MQQNGKEQQECKYLSQTVEPPQWKSEQNLTPASIPEEEPFTAEQQKEEEYLNLLRRTQADFMNYRRRMGQEQAEGRIIAQSELLSQLLPVLDDFCRALATRPPEMATNPWVQGLFLVGRRFTALLDQLGVQRIGTPGEPFDPRWHEAITTETRAEVPEGTILHVSQPGYSLGDRIIRPAQVSVASTSSPTSDASA